MRPPRGDDGSASLELSIVFPVALLLLLVIVQAGLYLFARNEAYSAARVGLDIARTQGSSPAAGISQAQSWLAGQNQSGLLTGITVTTDGSTPTTVHLRVQAHVTSIIPGLPVTVDEQVTGPVERLTTP